MIVSTDRPRRGVGSAHRPRPAGVATGRSLLRSLAAVVAVAASLRAGEPPRAFLFLKTGEKFATQEMAGPTVAEFTKTLGDYQPQVFNDPARAVEFCSAKKPPLGIVTPGFYLAYARALGMEPLLEVRRQNVPAERFVLVAAKDAGDDLRGKIIATTLGREERYITAVILQGKLGEEVRLQPVTDVEGAAFDLAEGAKGAADLVLMEQGAWKVIQKDEELGPKLKAVFISDELPRDLVVVFRPNADGLDTGKLVAALKNADKQILASIRVEAFVDVDQERLKKAQALFHAN